MRQSIRCWVLAAGLAGLAAPALAQTLVVAALKTPGGVDGDALKPGTQNAVTQVYEGLTAYARTVDAVVFTGGDDIDLTPFGLTNHPASSLMHPQRQRYEFALLQALDALPKTPVLGICLGMQFMALHRRGSLNPHLPDTHPTAADHRGDNAHPVSPLNGLRPSDIASNHPLKPVLFVNGASPCRVASNHHQAVSNPGSLRPLAISPDNVLEALDDPQRPFYLGVQWHPERTSDKAAGDALFQALVKEASRT